MKSTAIFFVIFAGSVFCSCSKAEITATSVSQTRAGDNEVSLLFTKDNLSESQAIEFATHFLKKTPFFYTWDVLHFLPRNYIQYNEPFEVWYSGFTIHFRGIDVGIAGPVTADLVRFGIYAGQVVRDVQIYSAGEKPEIGEVVYEERDGRKVPERGTNTIRIPKAVIVGFLSNGRVSAISKRASDIENLSNP